MKIIIEQHKEDLLKFVFLTLSEALIGRRVDFIQNGEKNTGSVENISFDENGSFFIFDLDEVQFKVPVFEETQSRFGKELFFFQTKKHVTIIEVLD